MFFKQRLQVTMISPSLHFYWGRVPEVIHLKRKFDYVIETAKELQSTSNETLGLLTQCISNVREGKELYGSENETKSPLLSLGITLLVLPDPITTPVGAGMILLGIAQQKLFGPPLYARDIHDAFNTNVLELIEGIDSFSRESTCERGWAGLSFPYMVSE